MTEETHKEESKRKINFWISIREFNDRNYLTFHETRSINFNGTREEANKLVDSFKEEVERAEKLRTIPF